jgi:hypothetical protein
LRDENGSKQYYNIENENGCYGIFLHFINYKEYKKMVVKPTKNDKFVSLAKFKNGITT